MAGDTFFPSPDRGSEQTDPAPQASLKAQAWVEIMRRLKVAALVPGPTDFAWGTNSLVDVARHSDLSVVSAHAPIDGLYALSSEALLRVGPRRIALFDGEVKSATADLKIVFRRGEQELSTHVIGADVVIHTGLRPPRSFATIDHGTLHVSAGEHGEEPLVLELWPAAGPGAAWQLLTSGSPAGERNQVRIQRHRLSAEKPSDPEVRRLLDQLFAAINAGNRKLAATTAARQEKRSLAGEKPAYMGARTCAACHTEAYFAWLKTPHARAYRTLIARHRELDVDCIGCHVTGFDRPGGAALGHLDELLGVGCESCHGPGEAHSNNPRTRLRSVHRAVAEAECRACHDPAHSDAFDFAQKRQRLLVPGHGIASARAH
jgi:predicted CXXCH cytochrome family protein